MLICLRAITWSVRDLRPIIRSVQDPRAVTRWGGLMSITPNLCCDETKNQGTYTRVTPSTIEPSWMNRKIVNDSLPFSLYVFLHADFSALTKLSSHFKNLFPAILNWWSSTIQTDITLLCTHELGWENRRLLIFSISHLQSYHIIYWEGFSGMK